MVTLLVAAQTEHRRRFFCMTVRPEEISRACYALPYPLILKAVMDGASKTPCALRQGFQHIPFCFMYIPA